MSALAQGHSVQKKAQRTKTGISTSAVHLVSLLYMCHIWLAGKITAKIPATKRTGGIAWAHECARSLCVCEISQIFIDICKSVYLPGEHCARERARIFVIHFASAHMSRASVTPFLCAMRRP